MADTKYCYPNSDVLINKLDIHDMDKLKVFEGLVMTAETERRISDMCNLSELLIEEGVEKGIEKGIEKGEERKDKLFTILNESGRLNDYAKAINDKEFLTVLYKEFNLI